MKHIPLNTPEQKDFYECFKSLIGRYDRWQVWSDFVTLSACSLCLSDRSQRMAEYVEVTERYRPEEMQIFPKMLSSVVVALTRNPDQDFLGDLFMRFELGNDRKGQFFTPHSISRVMAALAIEDIVSKLERQPWVSVNDPTCGAGSMLIAFAQECYARHEINYQTSVLFTAQDVDYIAAKMCFIQLSLLGCPGYVVIGNTITNPIVTAGSSLLPVLQEGQEIWYTPMFYTDIWQWRIAVEKLKMLEQNWNKPPDVE